MDSPYNALIVVVMDIGFRNYSSPMFLTSTTVEHKLENQGNCICSTSSNFHTRRASSKPKRRSVDTVGRVRRRGQSLDLARTAKRRFGSLSGFLWRKNGGRVPFSPSTAIRLIDGDWGRKSFGLMCGLRDETHALVRRR